MREKETVLAAIEALEDPSSGKALGETKGVKYLSVEDDTRKVNLVIALNDVDDKTKAAMTRSIAKVVKLELGYAGLIIDYQRLKLDKSILGRKDKVKYIAIASGKGGVGKSTIAANLALALTRIGQKVGLIDADIYGSSIPSLFDMESEAPKATDEKKMVPHKTHGIEIMSAGFFLKDDKPVMWRGPMLGKMLNHFFYDTEWDEDIEYMLIDLPPGTGDVAIDIQKLIPACKILIVTTPHKSASRVAIKAGYAAKELNHTLLGVVENMSSLEHKGETLTPFGEGGADEVARKLGADVMARLPLAPPKDGHHSLFPMDDDTGILYLGLANRLIKSFE